MVLILLVPLWIDPVLLAELLVLRWSGEGRAAVAEAKD
jgi:hypothetical protein